MKMKMTPEAALEQASEIAGSMQALADKLGVTKGAVGQWKLPSRRIPAEHCPAIERLTAGCVRCEDLRPDVDWAIVRSGTPDRAGHADGALPADISPRRRKDDFAASQLPDQDNDPRKSGSGSLDDDDRGPRAGSQQRDAQRFR